MCVSIYIERAVVFHAKLLCCYCHICIVDAVVFKCDGKAAYPHSRYEWTHFFSLAKLDWI